MHRPNAASVLLMVVGAALVAGGVAVRRWQRRGIFESASEATGRGSSWPVSRAAGAGVAVGVPLFLIGAVVALSKAVPLVAAVVAAAYTIVLVIGLTLGRAHRGRQPTNGWQRFVALCRDLAEFLP